MLPRFNKLALAISAVYPGGARAFQTSACHTVRRHVEAYDRILGGAK